MTDSGKAFTDQHDIDEIEEDQNKLDNHNDPVTDEVVDDNEIEVGSNQVDDTYKKAFGNDPDGKTIKQAINKDEVTNQKDLQDEEK